MAVCAAMLKPGMVGDGSDGSAPFSGCPPPVPIARPEKLSGMEEDHDSNIVGRYEENRLKLDTIVVSRKGFDKK